jgi:hypothetical protein
MSPISVIRRFLSNGVLKNTILTKNDIRPDACVWGFILTKEKQIEGKDGIQQPAIHNSALGFSLEADH